MSNRSIYTASRIFTGDGWLKDHAIIISNSIIEEIVPVASLGKEVITEDFPDSFIAPAFIDFQVYGAQGRLLSAYPEPGSLAKLADHCRKSGTAWCLPTVATNELSVFYKAVDAIREYWKSG